MGTTHDHNSEPLPLQILSGPDRQATNDRDELEQDPGAAGSSTEIPTGHGSGQALQPERQENNGGISTDRTLQDASQNLTPQSEVEHSTRLTDSPGSVVLPEMDSMTTRRRFVQAPRAATK